MLSCAEIASTLERTLEVHVNIWNIYYVYMNEYMSIWTRNINT